MRKMKILLLYFSAIFADPFLRGKSEKNINLSLFSVENANETIFSDEIEPAYYRLMDAMTEVPCGKSFAKHFGAIEVEIKLIQCLKISLGHGWDPVCLP